MKEPESAGAKRLGTFVADCFAGWVPALWSHLPGAPERLPGDRYPAGLSHEALAKATGHAFTPDLHYWRGAYYLAYVAAPWHIGSSRSRVHIVRSVDFHHWEPVAEFRLPRGDIRDPKLFGDDERLFLLVLRNDAFVAEPNDTFLASSDDGRSFTPFRRPFDKGWLFWKPVRDEAHDRWLVSAYWHEHGRSVLLESDDGIRWTALGPIYEGDRNDETAIFLEGDGTLVATARLEVTEHFSGHDDAGTWVGRSRYPYTKWEGVRCPTTRLDGPSLFTAHGKTFAVGRRHGVDRVKRAKDRMGSYWTRKRTSVFAIEREGLRCYGDLPSGGDTGYAGTVVKDGVLHVVYYTTPLERDPSSFRALFLPTEIRLARVPLSSLATPWHG